MPNIITEIQISNCNFYALWDTGSWHSAISSNVINQLNLIPIGETSAGTAGNVLNNVPVFRIDLSLIAEGVSILFPKLNVLEINLGRKHYDYLGDGVRVEVDVIIGMDIIKNGDFKITQLNNRTFFSFTFPSKNF
jgi:hypothetical protein